MKQKDYHIYLDEQEYSQVIQSLIALKNDLIAQDRYTDAVDDVLIKFTKARNEKDDRAIHLNKTAVMPLVSLRRSRRLFCVLGQFSRAKKFFSNFFGKGAI